jgi:glycosyltransferase involved in cell wall biosynthesis
VKVSICIPAYRQVEYLRATLRSIEQQDFQDYELIVSDDSPDDSVRDLLAGFDFGHRLRYVRNTPALGSPENWNAAVRLARGDYVKLQHHDDHFVRPDALRRFVELLDAHPDADFGFAASLVRHVDSGLERVHRPTEQQLAALRADPVALFHGNCIGAPSATIVRKGLGIEYDRRMKWLVDVDYYYRVLMRNGRFAYAPEVLVGTPTNATHQVTELCRDDAQVEIGEAMQLYAKFTPEQRRHRLVQRGWEHLFRRFRMRKLGDFDRLGLPLPEETAYFEQLLKYPLARWELIFHPRLLAEKVFNRLYPHLPRTLQQRMKRRALGRDGEVRP